MIGQQSHEAIFNIAARLDGKTSGGAFIGAIVVSVDQAYFTSFYRENERENGHVFVLAHEDRQRARLAAADGDRQAADRHPCSVSRWRDPRRARSCVPP